MKRRAEEELVAAKAESIQMKAELAAYTAGMAKRKNEAIRLRDALGRRFHFPYERVRTWAGISSLISKAFEHIEPFGRLVDAEHYDLVGPMGQIILPGVWEEEIEPGWAVTMHMWPMKEHNEPPPPA